MSRGGCSASPFLTRQIVEHRAVSWQPALMPVKAPVTTLDFELAEEQAGALGRLGRELVQALAALRQEADGDLKVRQRLTDRAGEVLWMFLIQREAIGLRDERAVFRTYGVPAAVIARMGVMPQLPDTPHADGVCPRIGA